MDGLVTKEVLGRVWRVEGRETPDHFSLAFPGTDPDGSHLLHPLCDPRLRHPSPQLSLPGVLAASYCC